jgi:2OG-Fe(II) oxygenase superfamily
MGLIAEEAVVLSSVNQLHDRNFGFMHCSRSFMISSVIGVTPCAMVKTTSPIPKLLIEDGFLAKQFVLFHTLVETVAWDLSMSARKTASFGVPYNYVQMTYQATPLHPALSRVSDRLFDRLGVRFNNCLLNYYETGHNRMGYHADDTSGLEPGTGVAIVSIGSPRAITYRHKEDPELRHKFTLQPGSLLYMDSEVQDEWFHAINRQKDVGPRISLTWRQFREG